MSCRPDVFVGDAGVDQHSVVEHPGGVHLASFLRLQRGVRQADVIMPIKIPVLLQRVVRLMRMGERGHQEKGRIVHAGKVMQFGFGTIKDGFIMINLNAAPAYPRANHATGVVVGVHAQFFPARRPGKIRRIEFWDQALFKSVQHVGPDKMLFTRETRAIAGKPQVVSHGGKVCRKFRTVIVSADLAGQYAREH